MAVIIYITLCDPGCAVAKLSPSRVWKYVYFRDIPNVSKMQCIVNKKQP